MVYLKYKPSKLQIEDVSDELKFVRYMCGGRISSFGRSLAVIEEITEGVSKIFDIVDMMPNEYTAVDESIGEDDSVELDLGVKNLPELPDTCPSPASRPPPWQGRCRYNTQGSSWCYSPPESGTSSLSPLLLVSPDTRRPP